MKKLTLLFATSFIICFSGLVFLSIELIKKNLILHQIYAERKEKINLQDKNENGSDLSITDLEYRSVLQDYQNHLNKNS